MSAGVLESLGALARERAATSAALTPPGELRRRAAALRPPRDVLASLRRAGRPALVAEFKRASPSAGSIAPAADPAGVARLYADAGAAMVSVLTEPTRFGGSLEDLRRVRAAVDLPVLQKDFVVDPYQLLEARVSGADAVLLIVALVGAELERLYAEACALGLTVLVEAHTEAEVDRAVGLGAPLIGVNNRDLSTLTVDTAVAHRLLPLVPADRFALAESGLRSPADVARAIRAGADGVLVGEHLMASGDPATAARALRHAGRRYVKVCGITRRADAEAAAAAGVDAVGFVFAGSPRQVSAQAAAALGVGLGVERVGVFVGGSAQDILATAAEAGLSGAQLHGGAADEATVTALRAGGLDVMVAVGQDEPEAMERLGAAARAGALPLIDARLGHRPDGRGGTLDLERAQALAQGARRIVLAGGLDPESVGAAAALLDPYGVDVSGGVERSPGVKDAERIRAFVAAARDPASARSGPARFASGARR